MGEKWIEMVEEVTEAMSEADIEYFSNYIWVGNAEVEAWFYPDGVCHVSRDGEIQTVRTQDAGALLAEQPPEELF